MLILTVVTLAVCGIAALVAARRRTMALSRWLGAFYLCVLPLFPQTTELGSLRFVILGIGLVWLAVEELTTDYPRPELARTSARLHRTVLACATIAIGALLFRDLDLVPGWTLAWEKDIVDGLSSYAHSGVNAREVITKNLEWDLGALNTAHRSLFYGTSAHLLMTAAGYSELTLRLPALAFTLLTLIVLYRVTSRYFGPATGAASAIVFATSESVLFYGRYGSSPSGTLLAMLLAYWACLSAVSAERHVWWRAILAAILIYLATLQYAVGRIPACVLAVLTPLGILAGPAKRASKLSGSLCFAAVLSLVWWYQSGRHAQMWFFNVRGEQISVMLRDPYEHERVLGIPWDGKTLRKELPAEERVRFVRTLLTRFTLPELAAHLSPVFDPEAAPLPVQFDPPLVRPYLAPFVVFLVAGVACSLRKARQWKHAALLAWTASSLLALVFTNRVDGHRLTVVVLPFTIWIAIGFVLAGQRLRAAGVHHFIVSILGGLVVTSALPYLAWTLQRDPPPNTMHTRILAAEIDALTEDVLIGLEWPRVREAAWNHEQVGSLTLHLLERRRRNPDWDFEMLTTDTVNAILDDAPNVSIAHGLLERTMGRTLVLAPAERFRGLGDYLESRGAKVEVRSHELLPVMIVRAEAINRSEEGIPSGTRPPDDAG